MKFLVLFHSYDGQTARIARRIGEVIGARGHQVTVHRFTGSGALAGVRSYDAIVLGAAVRYGRYGGALEKEIARHAADLAARPNAFFSVCMSAARPGANLELARRYLDDFRRRTGWEPREVATFAGALLYRKYNPLLRLVMRFISSRAGGETDTSRDYEYTDWAGVDRFAEGIAGRLPVPAAA